MAGFTASTGSAEWVSSHVQVREVWSRQSLTDNVITVEYITEVVGFVPWDIPVAVNCGRIYF